MKKQVTLIVLGALLSLAMNAPAVAAKRTAHHEAKRERAMSPYAVSPYATSPSSSYYDSAVPEGDYTNYTPPFTTGNFSGAMAGSAIGGIGR